MNLKKPPKGSGLYIKQLSDGSFRYHSRIWSPPLCRIGKDKTWTDTDLNVVLKKHYELKAAFIASNYELITERPKHIKPPELLLDCAAMYEKYLHDDPALVQAHQVKGLDPKYIQNTLHYIHQFLAQLKVNGYRLSHTTIQAIDQTAIAWFFSYLQDRIKKKEIGSVTFNKHIKANREWFNYLADQSIVATNPFKEVKLKTERTDPQLITTGELKQLLAIITPANGYGFRGTDKKKISHHRDWLKSYLLLSVFIGGRPDQVANLRWKDWTDEYITLQNEKVNRLKKEAGNVVYIFIHPELADLLAILSKGMQSENDFILVPDHENRKTLKNFVSRAFQHYWQQLGIDKNVTLNNLRHTYVNAILETIGESGIGIHHKKETAVRHYLSKKKRLDLEKGQSLFDVNVAEML
jgi:integrase